MTTYKDTPERYGPITRFLHWGMAVLFAAQFASAAAHWALPRENALRETLWSYHVTLGVTLFILVFLRGIWGLLNIPSRPPHSGAMGQAAVAGHVALYALMILVPSVRLLAAAGGERGLTYLGLTIFPPRETEIAWTQVPAEWHGEMGWILALLILGHIAMATIWHHLINRDGVLKRMAG
ncbi:cytochrome b [Fulvimarina endophytica]|uniref:Cytochrome b n=1 Tax=Fulvimarina endophytica TaxID=2293836 RepID=A0A371X2G2_9HYPH|nr:cytochrome b [Fulvimarina endophytica]RFC63415.1 cytochrome b [Fulvimarina endophytica]